MRAPTRWAALAALLLTVAAGTLAAAPAAAAQPFADDFRRLEAWRAVPADGVALTLSPDRDETGAAALRLDFDFRGHGGWASARREVTLTLPPDWALRLRVRGEGPPNALEIKLSDRSGENVWWTVRRDWEPPREWTTLRSKRERFSFAWGPAGGGAPREIGAIEIAVTAGSGGRGSLWLSELAVEEVAPREGPLPTPRASATSSLPGHAAAAALDGALDTSWRPRPGPPAELVVDLGLPRELGGVTLRWDGDECGRRFALEFGDERGAFTLARELASSGAPRHDLFLPESEARFLRLRLLGSPSDCGLAELVLRPLAFGDSRNAFFEDLAREAARGTYPRGFSGEQVYWTVVGADGDAQESYLTEDGVLELGEAAPSLEPLLEVGSQLFDWSGVEAEHSLREGDLPLPTVTWAARGVRLEITAFAAGEAGASTLLARYRIVNASNEPQRGRLLLALRPFQANPPQQFLMVPGGVAVLARLEFDGRTVRIEGRRELATFPPPAQFGAASLAEGPIPELIRRGREPQARSVDDPERLASALLAWPFALPAGGRFEAWVVSPYGDGGRPLLADLSALSSAAASERLGALESETATGWRRALSAFDLRLPGALGADLVRTARMTVATILIHRDGAAIQPGSRAYARSWIRDGALTSSALLRLGHTAEAQAFVEWFAGFQYQNGKVPCCVDRRGADPVPEHDSHGQLIHLIHEVFRYGGDRAFATRLLPSVERAVDYLEHLRQQRRSALYLQADHRRFFGLLPESISHEGYSAKPMHSYWDGAFAARGYADAVALAEALGREDLATRWRPARDQFRSELLASLGRVMAEDGIDHLPGCAELADFDPTSTTALLAPGGLQAELPPKALAATFERYFREAVARGEGRRAWDVYTPYEWRNVGAFARLGWRERIPPLLDFLLRGRRPRAWLAWAEVVGRESRAPRFIGDLPHGWVGSDFLRALFDLLAYDRESDFALVLGAGVPAAWLAEGEVAVRGLRTPWGALDLSLESIATGGVRYRIGGSLRPPPGGFVPTWPWAGRPGRARLDGAPLQVAADGSVRVLTVPATVELLP